ncbi:MAG: hypothetical protein HY906_15695 [Deltaproteobacteria bacterium]|nr:hypothetical protein [Deltaproteobacteria bacterium]
MEAMALESLVASVWRQEGFLTVVRHAIRVEGGYSDVDVVGVRADGVVRVGECKARGAARSVNVDVGRRGWSSWWDASLRNLTRLWDDRPPWLPAVSAVSRLEFHLVGNVWFRSAGERQAADARLTKAMKTHVSARLKRKSVAKISPSVDLVIKAISSVRNDVVDEAWGKRFGDPLLDAVRELVRYLNPMPAGAGRLRGEISAEVSRDLAHALGLRVAE